jgi:hypothetical protein
MNRRRFLHSVAVAAGAATSLEWASPAEAPSHSAPLFHRWFPQLRPPQEIWLLPTLWDVQEAMILESASGLMTLAVQQGNWDALIYEDAANDGYQRWFDAYCKANSPKLVKLTLDEVVTRLVKANLVQGYILYRYEQSNRPLHTDDKLDESVNVATSLASAKRCLIVSEALAERVQKLGLKEVLDVRERSEKWCLAQHDFSRAVLGTADPKTRNIRSLMIGLNAFVCSGRGEAYKQALARCSEDAPIIGWGCDSEDRQTSPSSKWGLFQTATNWCNDLNVFASDVVGKSIPAGELRHRHPLHWSALDWGDGLHHVSFTMSDGDNVQWMMGNFTSGGEGPSYYGNPKRGSIPFTWGLAVPSLCQLSPRTLAEIMAKATPNDDFMQFSGGGYFYPDQYGKARGTTRALELHAERLRQYMELTGIRILAFNFMDWDGAEARAACEIFASKLPGLLGIFAFQYYPYSAGKGAIYWVKGSNGDEVPVVSCRFTVWAQTGRPHDAAPASVAAQLNRLPTAAKVTSQDAFSWVLVHAWSRFRRAAKDAPLDAEEKDVAQDKVLPETARGYEPALWAAERLESRVKAVSASELLWRIRLRLRPQATLSRCLAEIEHNAQGKTRSKEFKSMTAEIRSLLPRAGTDTIAARQCFELLKRA